MFPPDKRTTPWEGDDGEERARLPSWSPLTEDDVWADLSWMDSLRKNGKTRLIAAAFGVDIDDPEFDGCVLCGDGLDPNP